MPEILASISTVIATAKKLKEIGDKIRDAELKNVIADLNLHLADVKMALAEVQQENTSLKSKIRELESVDGEPCPRCRKRGWQIVKSVPDPVFREAGVIRRTYECSFCQFSEDKLIH